MEKLQKLLEKIYNDGIKKYKHDGDYLIKNAQEKADLIVSNAKKKAELILNESILQAKQNELKSNLVIKQVARDIVILLEKNIMNRLKSCINKNVCDVFSSYNFMERILERIIDIYSKEKNNDKIDFNVIFTSKDINKMTSYFTNKIGDSFKMNPKILEDEEMSAGLKINFKDNNFYLDYSNNSLTNIICKFVEPKLAEIIKK